ncbi:MAG: 1,4-dihydroxy-2-naphthoate octaprenyltransferase [Akkermansiaceae bacterium]|jgi:1,4-dihydroxy-2-naphthoate octaprenyltransferase|nr:1,4-dihydroxy-2-naphthoate octaprenyltransferase [Luteolibacter sp.]
MSLGTLTKAVISGARPKTLAAGLVPVWLGGVLAWKLTGNFDTWLWSCTLLGALCIQVATNFFNDAMDGKKGADGQNRTGPRRLTGTGEMSFGQVMMLGVVFLTGAVIFGAPLVMARGWPILAIGLSSLFLAYGYTGGPFPLAYRGLGEIFVILFFGFIAVMGTVFIQTETWPHEAILLGAQVGLLSAVLISVNNFRDREQDALVGKKTLAVRFGPKFSAGIIWLEIKLAAFLGIVWLMQGYPLFCFSSLPVFVIGMRIIWGVLTLPPGKDFNKLLALAALQLILFAAVFHVVANSFN